MQYVQDTITGTQMFQLLFLYHEPYKHGYLEKLKCKWHEEVWCLQIQQTHN
jgi:hypothetical protein